MKELIWEFFAAMDAATNLDRPKGQWSNQATGTFNERMRAWGKVRELRNAIVKEFSDPVESEPRAAFERFMERKTVPVSTRFDKHDDGSYVHKGMQFDWEVYKQAQRDMGREPGDSEILLNWFIREVSAGEMQRIGLQIIPGCTIDDVKVMMQKWTPSMRRPGLTETEQDAARWQYFTNAFETNDQEFLTLVQDHIDALGPERAAAPTKTQIDMIIDGVTVMQKMRKERDDV